VRFDLDALAAPASLQELPIDAIDEDPFQPRQEFEPSALQELAETIAERGVLQPVSVRNHPKQPARYILNFGARRLRASRLAKKTSIPAFVDDLATSYDQVIENEQREGLTPLELALFIERRLDEGDSQAEIARRLGKSKTYVTLATALIGAPDWLMALYRDGRCRGLRELHELRQLQLRCPVAVRRLESDREPITRHRIAAVKAELAGEGTEGSSMPPERDCAANALTVGLTSQTGRAEASENAVTVPVIKAAHPDLDPKPARGSSNGLTLSYALLADLHGSVVEVIVDSAPSEDGNVFVRISGEVGRQAVAAGDLKLIRLVPRSVR
jgi:ParB family chromosome partitioning protein